VERVQDRFHSPGLLAKLMAGERPKPKSADMKRWSYGDGLVTLWLMNGD
jgi:hypothetical protein